MHTSAFSKECFQMIERSKGHKLETRMRPSICLVAPCFFNGIPKIHFWKIFKFSKSYLWMIHPLHLVEFRNAYGILRIAKMILDFSSKKCWIEKTKGQPSHHSCGIPNITYSKWGIQIKKQAFDESFFFLKWKKSFKMLVGVVPVEHLWGLDRFFEMGSSC